MCFFDLGYKRLIGCLEVRSTNRQEFGGPTVICYMRVYEIEMVGDKGKMELCWLRIEAMVGTQSTFREKRKGIERVKLEEQQGDNKWSLKGYIIWKKMMMTRGGVLSICISGDRRSGKQMKIKLCIEEEIRHRNKLNDQHWSESANINWCIWCINNNKVLDYKHEMKENEIDWRGKRCEENLVGWIM